MNVLKTLQQLEAATERCSEKYTFLNCRETFKSYKSESNPLKILKGFFVKDYFWYSCGSSICNFVKS